MCRRAASAASTMRAREAASCLRASTLASAAVTSSAKLPILASVPAGKTCASSLAINSRGSDRAGSSLREATKRHRSPLRALLAGLVDMSSRVTSAETLANHLAFLQIDLSDPEFHQLALAYTTAVREEIKRLLDATVEASSTRPTPHGSRSASRRPTAVHGSLGPSTARAGSTPGCGANSTRYSRPTEPHDPSCGRASSAERARMGYQARSRGSHPSRPQGTPSRARQMAAQNASRRRSPP
jgi:hypothetical protein